MTAHDLWTAPRPTPVDGPLVGDDRPMPEGYLAFQRATFLNICAGLTAEQLAAHPVPSSELSLLGLIRHLAKAERIWLRNGLAGEDIPHLYGGPGRRDCFTDTDPARAEAELDALRDEWRLVDAAVAGIPFTFEFDFRGQTLSLRMVYVHLIGEYARHNGHADLLREAIDGVTGR